MIVTDKSALVPLFGKNPVTSNLCNPGGRQMEFQDGKKIQLTDWCDTCDIKALIDLLT